jgi:signal transduction histidine kinase
MQLIRQQGRTGTRDRGAAIAGIRGSRADWLLAGILGLATIATAFTSLPFALYEPQLDVALLTTGTVVALAVSGLSFARYREHGAGEGLLEASAFLVLAVASLANLVAIMAGADRALGLTLGAPGQLPLYFWAAARLLSAGLLAAGALLGPAPAPAFRSPRLVVWTPVLLLGLACVGLWMIRDAIPVLVDPATLERLADETISTAPLPGINAGIFLLDGSACVLLVIAAVAYSRADRGAAGIPRRYLVPALILAVYSQIQFILYPAVYTGLVSTGDVLRVLSYVVLAAGLLAGLRQDLQALRSANSRLRVLASAEADRTAIAESARLARELHDGIAQDLWTAKLELDRLGTELDGTGGTVGEQFARTRDAVEAARAEAQAAVLALRAGFDAGLSVQEELPRRLDAFTARTGYLVDLELDADVRVTGTEATEVLRVLDEALHNVEKHADATRIRVRLAREGPDVLLVVGDNGGGFVVTEPVRGHGILGMRERAALLGGTLVVESAPGDGTRVTLRFPAGATAGTTPAGAS